MAGLWFRAGQTNLGFSSYLQLNKNISSGPEGQLVNSTPALSLARWRQFKTSFQLRPLRRIKELISRLDKTEKLDASFVFPYSTDKEIKRQQLIDNLQKGLLLEDKGILIPWLTPFNQVDKYKEKRRDRGDRTEWFLGSHTIIDGYKCELEIMMWMYLPWRNPITEISADLGFDEKGMNNFYSIKNHLVDRVGEPHRTDIKKWGDLDLGIIEWKFDKVKIALVGIEHFAGKYSFTIGLTKDRNKEYFDQLIENLKASGLTEEEMGK